MYSQNCINTVIIQEMFSSVISSIMLLYIIYLIISVFLHVLLKHCNSLIKCSLCVYLYGDLIMITDLQKFMCCFSVYKVIFTNITLLDTYNDLVNQGMLLSFFLHLRKHSYQITEKAFELKTFSPNSEICLLSISPLYSQSQFILEILLISVKRPAYQLLVITSLS